MTVIPIRWKRLRLLVNHVRSCWARADQPHSRNHHTWVEVTRYCDTSPRQLCTTCGIIRHNP